MDRVKPLILLLGLLSFSCSRIPPCDEGFVDSLLEDRIHSSVEWRKGCSQSDEVHNFIQCSVANELNADIAIQIALLNNPKIQATFEQLGIAQADLVEAGLLSNPSFAVEIRYPHVKGLKTNIEYLLTKSLLDIFLIPLRTKLAEIEFQQTKLKVSNEILDLAFEVRKAYYDLVAERKKVQIFQSILELTSIMSDISLKQNFIGNTNAFQFQLSQARLIEAELELSRAQAEIIHKKEKLNRLLGFSEDVCLLLPKNLSDIDYYPFDLCTLESVALEKRLDLQVLRFEIVRLCHMLGLKDSWTYTHFQGGVAGERDTDGTNVIGFGFSGEIPLFNYGQAARLRLYAELRQAKEKLKELTIKVLSEVREAHQIVLSYLKITNDYETRLLPMQEKISSSGEELYNVMGLGVDKLLEKKLQEVVATKNYIESLKNYFVARVELDRALGGYLFKVIGD